MSSKGVGSFTNREGPGPGEYSHKTIFQKIGGAATFGKNKRMDPSINRTIDATGDGSRFKVNELPGPGTY